MRTGSPTPSSASSAIESWLAYLIEHRDEITAIQLISESKERSRVRRRAGIGGSGYPRPPYNWTPDYLWHAYEVIDPGRVRKSDRHTLTDLVSLLRYSVGADEELVPYADRVRAAV